MRAAVFDLGSTSFQLVVAEVDATAMTVLARDREMLRLGSAVTEHKVVPSDTIAAAVNVVDRFRRGAALAGAEVVLPVATSALRDAANGDELLAALSEAAGAPIRLLDGETEARLALAGMRGGVPALRDPVVGIDLGGGSLDLAVGGTRGYAASLPLGVMRLYGELGVADPMTRSERRIITNRVRKAVEAAAVEVRRIGPRTCVATGGVIGALARVVLAARGGWLPPTPNGAVLTADELEWAADLLVAMTLEERLALDGMEARRADVIGVGAVVAAVTASELGADRVVISEWGLREGVLLEAAGVADAPALAAVRDVTVDRLVADWNADDAHGRHVAHLACGLFDSLQRVHRLDGATRDMLVYGARLHDLGARVANGGHHKHGAYLVEHADLRGFSPEESAMLACLVRFHKGSGPKASYEPYASLTPGARKTATLLTAILQVADGLDRGHEQCVSGTRTSRTNGRLQVVVNGPGDVALACWAGQQKAELLSSVLGVDVRLQAATPSLAASAS